MTSESNAVPFLGRVISSDGTVIGTCFQVEQGTLVSAYHVIRDALSRSSGEAVEPGERVWFAPLGAAADVYMAAEVQAIEPKSDLVVLKSSESLPGSISHLALSANQAPGTPFLLTGVGTLAEGYDRPTYGRLNARGEWDGLTEDHLGRIRGSGTAINAEKGMSGCPVIRIPDGAVLGVLIERYESTTLRSAGRVWLARSEDLLEILPAPLLIPVRRRERVSQSSQNAVVEDVIDREMVTGDRYFVEPLSWVRLWEKAGSALAQGKVVIVSGPPGVGTTTFAKALMAKHLDQRGQIIGLEPEGWESPSLEIMPADPWRGYILNLRDPEHDCPDEQFINELADLGSELAGLQSRLVITVTDDVWSGMGGRDLSSLHRVRLLDSPNPVDLVQKYLSADDPRLVTVVEAESVTRHLIGMNAVQAVQAVAAIRAAADDYSDLDSVALTGLVASILDDHLPELNALFGRHADSLRSTDTGRVQLLPLSVEDRCLMVTLAFKQSARLSRIETDSRRLLSLLQGASAGSASFDSLEQIFGKPGLRGRLAAMMAEVVQGENVRFPRPTLSGATVRYVWENYSDLRPTLVRWLVGGTDLTDSELSAEGWLAELAVRNQDIGFIRELRRILITTSPDALVAVLVAALRDEHMRRQCERLLYYWAVQPEVQAVVVKATERHFVETRSEVALRRMQRVADSPKTSQETLENIVNSLLAVAKSDPSFSSMVASWIRISPSKVSSFLGCVAVLQRPGAAAWFIDAHDLRIPMGAVTTSLLSEPIGHVALVALLSDSLRDEAVYSRVLDHLAHAIQQQGALASLLRLPQLFDKSYPGRNPILDLSSRLKLSPASSSR